VSPHRVRIHEDFEADLVAQIDWLVAQGQGAVVSALEDSLDRVLELLSEFPSAGEAVDQEGRRSLRKLIFPKGPLVAWYLFDADTPDSDVWLLRLFHSRQRRPPPKSNR
jgi:plasmid stabilization system protein ParE